jgi:hypothetical protein
MDKSVHTPRPLFIGRKNVSKRSRRSDFALRRLAAGSLLILAGCASSAGSGDSRLQELQNASRQVATQEQQCMDAAVSRANDAYAQILRTPDASNAQRVQAVKAQRYQDLTKCKAEADNANEKISAGERAEYERQAQEENDRATMLRLIATPQP